MALYTCNHKIEREIIDGMDYVKIPLPICNEEWTFWSLDRDWETCK